MIIILISSYVTIPSALSLLIENDIDFMIMTPDINIYEFFKIIYKEKKLYYFDLPQSSLIPKNPYDLLCSIRDIKRQKKYLKEKIEIYKNYEIYFDLVALCDFEFWIIKELSKRNNIYYLRTIDYKTVGKNIYSLNSKIYKMINRLVYKTKLQPCINGHHLTLKLTESYLKDVNAKTIKLEVDYKKLSEFVKHKFYIPNKKILLLCGGVADFFVTKENYIKSMDEIISFLVDKFGSDEISIKAHPRYNVYLSKENELKILPSLLPASLVLNNFDIVIGYSSTAIAEASQSGKKVISLLKYFEPMDKSILNTYINYINSNMNRTNPIYFPENLEEFIQNINY